ncbi:MAG: nucleoside deaminase [Aggregatilineales bacterium]
MIDHTKFMQSAIDLSQSAVDKGNHPFGAVLVHDDKIILTAENTIHTANDLTNHAEMNLVRLAVTQYDADFLETCSLYTSTEPCPMCAGAIYWSNIRTVVYACSQKRFYDELQGGLFLPCEQVFAPGEHKITVIRDILSDEAMAIHKKYW